MADKIISHVEQLTPDRLTAILRQSGALTTGRAVAVERVAKNERFLSSNARLRPQYSPDARGALPPALFLKMVILEQEDEWLQASVRSSTSSDGPAGGAGWVAFRRIDLGGRILMYNTGLTLPSLSGCCRQPGGKPIECPA